MRRKPLPPAQQAACDLAWRTALRMMAEAETTGQSTERKVA